VTPKESLAIVNEKEKDSSESSLDCEEQRGRQETQEDVSFGDQINLKKENIVRIGFQNIGGFPVRKSKVKEDIIRQGLVKWEFDIFGVAETNLDWRLCKEEDKLPLRTKVWWEYQHVSWAFNSRSPSFEPRQYGGTAVFSVNQAVHRVVEKGFDDSLLGRWAWTRYKGKGNCTLRMISAYRPNPPTGPKSVYAQQNSYFLSLGQQRCPRQAFVEDLQLFLQECLEAGDQIVLALDGNCNMRDSDLQCMLKRLSMLEILISTFGNSGPATSKRNSSAVPIDGIWTTPGKKMEAGGYFKFDEVFMNTDHRCLWIDVSFINAFGHNMPPLFRPQTKRLHCRDPRLIDNFTYLYKKYALRSDLKNRVKIFEESYHTMTLDEVKDEYERIDELRCQITAKGELKCRKLRKGNMAFSPTLNNARLVIKAWSLRMQRANGHKVSSRLIARTLKKANLSASIRGFSKESI